MAKRWRPGPDGVLEEYDTETGEITGYQKVKEKRSAGRKRDGGIKEDPLLTKHRWKRDEDGRMVTVPPGQAVYTYDQKIVEAILAAVSEGQRIPQICEAEGMPPKHVIWRWLRSHPDFKTQYEEARRIAAYEYEHRAIQEAELADEENIGSAKLRVSTYQWACEVRDRATFGKSTKITGDVNAPVAFTIVTGVPQKEIEEK